MEYLRTLTDGILPILLINTLLQVLSLGLWLIVLVSDLRRRRIAIPVLLVIIVVSLIGRHWAWWLFTGVTLLLTRRRAIGLAPVGVGFGLLLNDFAPGLALGLGAWAWGMNWWAGGDAVILLALTLRDGSIGLVLGLIAVMATAVVVTLKRRQPPLTRVWAALNEAGQFQARTETEFPPETELPAAAVLAVVGMGLEIARLFGLMIAR